MCRPKQKLKTPFWLDQKPRARQRELSVIQSLLIVSAVLFSRTYLRVRCGDTRRYRDRNVKRRGLRTRHDIRNRNDINNSVLSCFGERERKKKREKRLFVCARYYTYNVFPRRQRRIPWKKGKSLSYRTGRRWYPAVRDSRIVIISARFIEKVYASSVRTCVAIIKYVHKGHYRWGVVDLFSSITLIISTATLKTRFRYV